MSLSTKEVDAAWDKLGMTITETNDRHAKFYYKGKLILATKRSFGSGKIEGRVPHLIRQQLKLTEAEFADLIACPLDLDGYIEILRRRGLIRWVGHQHEVDLSNIQREFGEALADPDPSCSRACRETVDGLGAARVAAVMVAGSDSALAIRPERL